MTIKLGINGFGRIGRELLRCIVDREDTEIEVAAVNDIAPADTMAHLLRYDSTYGTWPHEVSSDRHGLHVDGRTMRVTGEPDPAKLAWDAIDVDIVVDASGRSRDRQSAAAHLTAGARKVVLSAPAKNVDLMVVLGVNDDWYDSSTHHVISNGSCTTNCVVPMLSVLHRGFTVRRGALTTVHSYTGDQRLLDTHHKDLRRARSAAVNIIPTTTGAASAVGEVLPELAGKLTGIAVRVPVEDGSLTDLTVQIAEPATPGQINRAFADAASGYLKRVLRYTELPVVSRDIVGDPASCVFDASLTSTSGTLVKVFGWYDNERGYANRLADLADLIAKQL